MHPCPALVSLKPQILLIATSCLDSHLMWLGVQCGLSIRLTIWEQAFRPCARVGRRTARKEKWESVPPYGTGI